MKTAWLQRNGLTICVAVATAVAYVSSRRPAPPAPPPPLTLDELAPSAPPSARLYDVRDLIDAGLGWDQSPSNSARTQSREDLAADLAGVASSHVNAPVVRQLGGCIVVGGGPLSQRQTETLLYVLRLCCSSPLPTSRPIHLPILPLSFLAAQRATRTALDRPIADMDCRGLALADALESFAKATGQNVHANWNALEAAGIDRNSPVTLRLRDVRAGKVLELILEVAAGPLVKLGYQNDGSVIYVSTLDDISKWTDLRIYDVRDLIAPIQKFATPRRPPTFCLTGNPSPPQPMTAQEAMNDLITVITQTVDPDVWRYRDGSYGALSCFAGRLVFSQTPENHAKIEKLLTQLREAQ